MMANQYHFLRLDQSGQAVTLLRATETGKPIFRERHLGLCGRGKESEERGIHRFIHRYELHVPRLHTAPFQAIRDLTS